ncbi:DUF6266 family protein [Pedobacter frigoris]|uniref:Uncharacterized protein n=1 Tax=Pedobacter frigoris TaxID=2571272 RepID=A0A4U1CCN0_9SPHI|nr:DUF6266 family protein [Pedobacter frigoris]TKC03889.1 hypothetical protein FA047_18200 [Pedobacter frigoris]
MARMKNGPFGPIIGKIGNKIAYIRLGEPIIKMAPHKSNKPRTPAQIAASDRMRVVMELISPLNSFTNVGFKLAARGTNKTAQNKAVSYQLNNALQGVYPDLSVDYSKVRLAEGKLNPPADTTVTYADGKLTFTWDKDADDTYNNYRLHVMMVAYLPDTKTEYCCIMGARKLAGEDFLPFVPADGTKPYAMVKETCAETYLAFISNDGEAISNTVYTGRVVF